VLPNRFIVRVLSLDGRLTLVIWNGRVKMVDRDLVGLVFAACFAQEMLGASILSSSA
jgi:hypothetical protein